MARMKKNRIKKFDESILYLLPLLLIICFTPFIVRLCIYDSGLSGFDWFLDSRTEVDFFLYYRSIAFIIISCGAAILLSYRFLSERKAFHRTQWIFFLIAYAGLAFVSTIASPYRSYGFAGGYEHFESIWVVLGYCVITIYTYYLIKTDKELDIIIHAFFVTTTILCILGVTQLLGNDFLQSEIGKQLIIPEKYASLRDKLQFKLEGITLNQVYMTFYNPNYVGTFAALVFPICVGLTFRGKRLINKILWGILSVTLLICTLGSGSKSFILSMGAIVILALLFCRKIFVKHYKISILAILLGIVAIGAFFSSKNTSLLKYLSNALILSEDNFALKDFRAEKDGFVINYKDEEVTISYTLTDSGASFLFQDDAGNSLPYEFINSGTMQLTDDRFKDLQFILYIGDEKYPYYVGTVINGISIMFVQTEDGYQFVNSCGKVDEIIPAETAIFTNYSTFATARGYIWARTIPLLKKTIFLGTGADSFIFEFPHDDYVARFNAGKHTELVTKPHNLYLQIGVQYGMLALLSFLALCLIYFIQSCKIYWKCDWTQSRMTIGVCIMLGIIGYLVAGLANDSTLTVAPFFWILLGLGFAVNRMNQK